MKNLSLEQLIKQNIEEIREDQDAISAIEKKLEGKHQDNLNRKIEGAY